MGKKIKICIFIMVLIIGSGGVVYNQASNLDNNVYIVSGIEEDNDNINEDYINSKPNESNLKSDATIFVSGEVNNPGIVTIERDERLSDAIDRLGGVTEDADLNRINLAIKVEDEQHYIIPKIGENVLVTNNVNQTTYSREEAKVNINLATIGQLETLPGVGEATANKIVNYREENGGFNSIEEIKNVNGIGDKKYDDLKDKISID